MTEYWPSSFLRVCGPRRVVVHKLAKNERGQYPAILTEQNMAFGQFFLAGNSG